MSFFSANCRNFFFMFLLIAGWSACNHFFNHDIKKLIMMQRLEPRTAGLKPTKIGHVDRVNMAIAIVFAIQCMI